MFTKLSSFGFAPVYALLTDFARLDNFWDLFDRALGRQYDSISAASLRSQWLAGDFREFPPIEVVSSQVLGNANGAYAISSNTIYLSDSFIASATAQDLTAVVLEEFGHYVDARVNQVDTPGDEGELFSDLVRGVELSPAQLTRIQTEDDHAVIFLDGQLITVEEAGNAFGNDGYKQFGTMYTDNAYAITTDKSGNIYVSGTGMFYDISAPSGKNSSFLTKFNASGTQIWANDKDTVFQNPLGISLDGSGNIYAAGSSVTKSSIAKYDASGTQVWVKQFGLTDNGGAKGISVDNSTNIYAIDSSDVTRYDANGNQIWIKPSSGANLQAITTDSTGNIYVTGGSFLGDVYTNGDNPFVAKYDANGTQLWSKQFGTSVFESVKAIATDISGNVYIAGGTLGNSANLGVQDALIIKYDENGNQIWSKSVGSTSRDYATGISTDNNGDIYITGTTSGSFLGNNNFGGDDGFVVKSDASGNVLWAHQFGSTSDDFATGISSGSGGKIYITGTTNGILPNNGNLKGADAFHLGGADAYVVGYNANGNLLKDTFLRDKLTTPFIRFQSKDKPGTYLFAGEQEAASIRQNYKNFKEEGLAFQAAVEKTDPLMQPFYRFRNTDIFREGTYLFAGDQEAASIRQNYKNFVEEGFAFYAYSAGVGGGTTDFTRFQNWGLPGTYLFTDLSEISSVLTNPKFVYEGSAFAAAG